MTSWALDDCPTPDRDTKKVTKDAAYKFCEKLAAVVDDWEARNNLVSKIRSNILNAYQRDLELFEDQIRRIEGKCCVCLFLCKFIVRLDYH